MESRRITEGAKEGLQEVYLSLNPAQLKREIPLIKSRANWRSYTKFMRKRRKPSRLTLTISWSLIRLEII
jgi:hypothetical protein